MDTKHFLICHKILMSNKKYNIDLCKGTGLVQESLLLLSIYSLNMIKSDMTNKAIESNLLVKSSNKRIKAMYLQ